MKRFIDDLIPLSRVSEKLEIPQRSLRRAIGKSILPAVKISGRWFVLDSHVLLCLSLGRNVIKSPLTDSEKKEYKDLWKGE